MRTPALVGLLAALAGAGVGVWALAGGSGSAPEVRTDEEAGAEEGAAMEGAGAALHAQAPRAIVTALSGRIAANVVDAKSAPAAGVRVTARRTGPVYEALDVRTWGTGWSTPLESFRASLDRLETGKAETDPAIDVEGTTAADGTVELEVKTSGQYEVAARPAPPLLGTKQTVTVSEARLHPTATLSVLAGARLEGKVVDAADRGVAALLEATGDATGNEYRAFVPPTRTDPATGAFAFEALPAGVTLLTVRVPGRVTLAGIEAKVPHAGPLVIRLPGGGAVAGKVTNAAGEAIAGADVTATTGIAWLGSGSEAPSAGTGRATSGSDGAYRIEGLPPGRVTSVAALAAGYGLLSESPPLARWSGAVVGAKEDAVIDLVLRKTGSIVGRVTEVGTGAIVAGAEVLLTSGDANTAQAPEVVAVGEDGRYRFDAVALGRHLVVPRSPTHYFPPLEKVDPSRGASTAPASAVVVLTIEGEVAQRDLELKAGLPITGRVEGPDGAPVAGAQVQAVGAGLQQVGWQWGAAGLADPPLATSEADGTFRGVLPPRAAWVLHAHKGDLVGASSDPVALVAGAPPPSVVLKLVLGASLSGRVIDAEGSPLPGVSVFVWSTGADVAWSAENANATSVADGSFALSGLPPGPVQVGAYSQEGQATMQLDPPLTSGEKRPGLELRFAKTVIISGVVVDAQGAPVVGRNVSAQGQGGASSWASGAQTKGDGSFSLHCTPVRYQLTVADESGQNAVNVGDPVDAPASGLRLVYVAKARTAISGRVVDAGGQPVPLCLVSIGSRASPNPVLDEVVGGEFRRETDAPEPYTLRVSGARDSRGVPMNLRAKSVKVDDPAAFQTITLEAGAEVAGTVLGPDGKGVEGVKLVASAKPALSAVTEADGSFRIGGLDADQSLDVAVTPPSSYVASPSVKLRAGDRGVVVRLAAGAAIAGKVLGPDGTPLRQGWVSAQWNGGSANAQLGADGAFRLDGVAQDAIATVHVQPWGSRGAVPRTGHAVNVRAGTLDLVIRLEVGASIEGVIVRADGMPVSEAFVQATRIVEKGDATDNQVTSVNADGTFTIGGLLSGTYSLAVNTHQGTPMADPVRVDSPSRGVRIVVTPPVKLSGRIEGADLTGFMVTAMRAAVSSDPRAPRTGVSSNGTFSLVVLPDVEYFVTVSKRDDDRYGLFGPVHGGGPEIAISLAPGATIEGVLEDATGSPTQGWVRAKSDRWQGFGLADAQGHFKVRGLPPGRYGLAPNDVAASLVEADTGATGVHVRRTK